MKTESLDILQNSELPAAQARAILKVMELEMATAYGQLATRADLRAELAEVKADLRAEIAEVKADLRAETAAVRADLMRWTLTCLLGQTAVLLGLGYFLLEHFRR